MKKDSLVAGSAIDLKWQAESDADTLIRAKEVQMDKKRYAAAMDICRDRCKQLKDVMKGEAK
jgi:hypothetical protein